MTFCVGSVSNNISKEIQSMIRFFADDSELDQTVYIKPYDLAREYSVDLKYCNKLQMCLSSVHYNGGTFGIGNIKVYK